MDSTWINNFLQQDSNLLVFVNVLLQQLGLPVPSVPTMVLAASQSTGLFALATMLLAAVVASLIADWIWYAAGRKFGYRVLALLCKMSINPSSCVNQTEARFNKWGVWSLVFGKFIPGFATVAPPVAGALGMAPSSFFMALPWARACGQVWHCWQGMRFRRRLTARWRGWRRMAFTSP
jgi:membrane protein DedA with SNARE-associated domain